MKKVTILMVVLLMVASLCACGTTGTESQDSDFELTTEVAAEAMVEDALKEWMSTKFLSFDCDNLDFTITSTERSSRSFSGDEESGTMWYNAYGKVTFYNKYGDALASGNFSVLFGHNGKDSSSYVSSETVVNLT